MWLVECLVAGLFGIAFPLPPLPLCILVVGGCNVIVFRVYSRLGSFYLPVFSFLYFNDFHYFIIITIISLL